MNLYCYGLSYDHTITIEVHGIFCVVPEALNLCLTGRSIIPLLTRKKHALFNLFHISGQALGIMLVQLLQKCLQT